jgi:thiaminase/transcriptional activator TenA
MTWSAKSWQAIKPIYNSIIEMPFIEELMDGSLSLEKFQFYIAQDAWYLEHFGRSLALIGARANDIRDALAFIRFAEGAIIVENALHESYFNKYRVTDKGVPEPACHHYVHFLKSTAALEQVEVAVAAVLPCFWIYKQVGDYIYQNQRSGNNPFQEWIETYAGQEFGKLVLQALDICDEMAKNCTKTQQDAMTQAFITATRLEWMFWDSAYRLKQW